jgi:hypothetical protein
VATAYTIRYGRAKAGLGPGVDALFSAAVAPFDEAVPSAAAAGAAVVEDGVGSGGGSMTDAAATGLETGSGREGMVSSAEDVSIVTCLVTGGDWRSV